MTKQDCDDVLMDLDPNIGWYAATVRELRVGASLDVAISAVFLTFHEHFDINKTTANTGHSVELLMSSADLQSFAAADIETDYDQELGRFVGDLDSLKLESGYFIMRIDGGTVRFTADWPTFAITDY